MVLEEHREGVGFIILYSSCPYVGGQAHFQRNTLIQNIKGKGTHFHQLSVFYGHVFHDSCAMSYSICMAKLDGLPYGFQTEGFPCMDCNVEVLAPYIVEGFDMFLRWMTAFISCQVETHYASIREGHSQFRHFQGY